MSAFHRSLAICSFLAMTCAKAVSPQPESVFDYLADLPNLSFTYSILDESPRRDIKFLKSGKNFAFKWLNENQGQYDMYTFDGSRFYSLAFDQLVVSRSPFLEQSAGWFLDNPLYNAFKYFGGYDGREFSPEVLMYPGIVASIQDLLLRAKEGKPPNEKIKEFKCTFTKDYPLPTALHCVGINGYVTNWKIVSFFNFETSRGIFKLPTLIEYEVRDNLGRVIGGSSGKIKIDEESVKILDQEAGITDFQIPITAVANAMDRDTGIILKGRDFK